MVCFSGSCNTRTHTHTKQHLAEQHQHQYSLQLIGRPLLQRLSGNLSEQTEKVHSVLASLAATSLTPHGGTDASGRHSQSDPRISHAALGIVGKKLPD